MKLSELSNLCNAGLLYPDLAATALHWLYSRTKGDKDGRLVFSRSETKDSPFGKSVFGTYMREQYKDAKDMDCGALRKRIEIMANQLLKAEKITAADRALVSTLLQHKAETAALDYLPAGDTELAESEPEPAPELEQISEPEPTESTETSPPQARVAAVEARLEAIITALQHMNKAGLHTNEVLDYIRQKVDSQPAPLQPTTQSSDWLKEVIEAAEEFKYDNCRTTGDVVRFKLVLARAALSQPRVMSIGENAAWAKYNDLIHYIQTAEDSHDAETISESESESEDEDEETVRATIGAVLKAISKPRARKNQAPQDRAPTRKDATRSRAVCVAVGHGA